MPAPIYATSSYVFKDAETAAILTITHAGQNFVSATSLYGGTWTLFSQTLKKLRIEVRFFCIRVSVGIEDIEDIKADLDQALQASQE